MQRRVAVYGVEMSIRVSMKREMHVFSIAITVMMHYHALQWNIMFD